jgi:hypothetical protein
MESSDRATGEDVSTGDRILWLYERGVQTQHVKDAKKLKKEMNTQIRKEGRADPKSFTPLQPFGLSMEVLEAERQSILDATERVRSASGEIEEGLDLPEGFLEGPTGRFLDRLKAMADNNLRRIDEKIRLVQAFNHARLGIYNALKEGDENMAQEIASRFVARRPIAP